MGHPQLTGVPHSWEGIWGVGTACTRPADGAEPLSMRATGTWQGQDREVATPMEFPHEAQWWL